MERRNNSYPTPSPRTAFETQICVTWPTSDETSAGLPRADTIHINAAVFAFTLLIALATGVLFGLAPALQAARTDVQDTLRASGRGAGGSRVHLRLRSALVVGEVSLACLLLIGAGLMLRSFVNLLRAEPGFRPEHLLTARVSLPGATYKPLDTLHFW